MRMSFYDISSQNNFYVFFFLIFKILFHFVFPFFFAHETFAYLSGFVKLVTVLHQQNRTAENTFYKPIDTGHVRLFSGSFSLS